MDSSQGGSRGYTRQPGCQQLDVLPQLPSPGPPLLHCPAPMHRTYCRLQMPPEGFSCDSGTREVRLTLQVQAACRPLAHASSAVQSNFAVQKPQWHITRVKDGLQLGSSAWLLR